MQAVKRFEPDKGFRLATYARWWIKAAIQEYILRSWSLVRMGTTANQKKMFFNLRKVKNKISVLDEGDMRPDQVQIIARRLGATQTDVICMNRRLSGDVSLNAPIREDGHFSEWRDWLVDDISDQETPPSCGCPIPRSPPHHIENIGYFTLLAEKPPKLPLGERPETAEPVASPESGLAGRGGKRGWDSPKNGSSATAAPERQGRFQEKGGRWPGRAPSGPQTGRSPRYQGGFLGTRTLTINHPAASMPACCQHTHFGEVHSTIGCCVRLKRGSIPFAEEACPR
jgi:hypothetical protein